MRQPGTLPFFQRRAYLVGIERIAALRRSVSLFYLCADLAAVLGKPVFLFMEQRDGVLDEFVDASVWAALHVLLDERFEFGPKTNVHALSLLHNFKRSAEKKAAKSRSARGRLRCAAFR